ncbi:MAG: nitroreductase family protein [Anaerovoracaceae bacterium]|nr:nitroreductase family protein [Anaerovoracaceae bacterium]
MDLVTGIKERRSVRKFRDEKVPRELLEEVVNIAAYAPSWKNAQIARYIIVDNEETIKALANEKCAYGFAGNVKVMENAPAILILTYVKNRSGFDRDGSFSTKKEDGWEMFDAGIAAQTFCLAALEKGLGTVIMGYFDEDEIRKVIDIPQDQVMGALIPLGYPDEEPTAPPRKDASKLLTFV